MTNKTKVRRGRKDLKLLDLSFDCEGLPEQKTTPSPGIRVKSAWTRSAPIGYKSQGSQRGSKLHPPSPYSFNKSAEYQNQIQADLEQLITAESLMHVSSPTWAITVSHESNHSGESPLFVHRLLSPGKYDGKSNHRSRANNNRYSHRRPLSANDANRYHPNSTHQYLTKTGLRDVTQSELDLRLGKPTRTTLLRARQRVNSAPQNAYDIHREYIRRVDKLAESRKILTPSYSLQDLLEIPLEDESLHSFLTGARYNRAHYLDAKSLITHGVYMPRSNPGGCFIVPRNKHSDHGAEPATSLDSPGDWEHGSSYRNQTESSMRTNSSPVPPPQRPSSPQLSTAYDENNRTEPTDSSANQAEADGTRERETQESAALNGNTEAAICKENKERKNSLAAMRSMMSADDALSIKGKGLDNMRSSYHHVSAGSTSVSHTETPAILAVSVSGVSFTRSLSNATSTDRSLLVGQPLITPVPRMTSVRGQRRDDRKAKSAPVTAEKTPVQMEDKCFNVPSINSDENEDTEDVLNGRMDESHSLLSRKSHVRFADHVDVVSDEVTQSNVKVAESAEAIDRSRTKEDVGQNTVSCSADDAIPSGDDGQAPSQQISTSTDQADVSTDQMDESTDQTSVPHEEVSVPSENADVVKADESKELNTNSEGDAPKTDDNVVFFMTEEDKVAALESERDVDEKSHVDELPVDAMPIEQRDVKEQVQADTDDASAEWKHRPDDECQGENIDQKANNHLGSAQTLTSSDVLSQDDGDGMLNGVISVEISRCDRNQTKDSQDEVTIVTDEGSDITGLSTDRGLPDDEETLPSAEIDHDDSSVPIICVDVSKKHSIEPMD